MIKDILVNLDTKRSAAGEYAVSLAKLLGSELSATVCAFIPVYPTTTPMELIGADFVGAARATNKQAADAAMARFRQIAEKSGVETSIRVLEATVADASNALTEISRRFDLTVLSQAEPKEWDSEQLVETVLFGSGRPVLIVPYIQNVSPSFRSVTVCWDGSRAAARAVGDAMPFLQLAKSVSLITAAKAEAIGEGDPQMVRHLARHGVKAEHRHLIAGRGDEVNAILNHASDRGTDLIVMGGYGHARIREFVLGGVTRGMLGSMTVPVLMSH